MKIAPQIFHKIFILKPPNKYEMRSIGTVLQPKCTTKLNQFNITFRSPFLWNKLIISNSNLRQTENLIFFKNNVKKLLPTIDNIFQYF